MIKGVNHTIIEVTNPQNRYFERALLFVRPQLSSVAFQNLQQHADHFVQTVGEPPIDTQRTEVLRRRKQKRRILNGLWCVGGFGIGLLVRLLL
ncbi:MAG: hypothetical protein IKT68_05335 [Clostridia bacterium]|nr:hypothetical protein [Clostridia bacterium]